MIILNKKKRKADALSSLYARKDRTLVSIIHRIREKRKTHFKMGLPPWKLWIFSHPLMILLSWENRKISISNHLHSWLPIKVKPKEKIFNFFFQSVSEIPKRKTKINELWDRVIYQKKRILITWWRPTSSARKPNSWYACSLLIYCQTKLKNLHKGINSFYCTQKKILCKNLHLIFLSVFVKDWNFFFPFVLVSFFMLLWRSLRYEKGGGWYSWLLMDQK